MCHSIKPSSYSSVSIHFDEHSLRCWLHGGQHLSTFQAQISIHAAFLVQRRCRRQRLFKYPLRNILPVDSCQLLIVVVFSLCRHRWVRRGNPQLQHQYPAVRQYSWWFPLWLHVRPCWRPLWRLGRNCNSTSVVHSRAHFVKRNSRLSVINNTLYAMVLLSLSSFPLTSVCDLGI